MGVTAKASFENTPTVPRSHPNHTEVI